MNARITPCVLIADDDPGARLLQGAALEGGGFEVVTAQDGLEALELFKRRRPDCLVLDVVMPGLDGFELCRRIRALAAGRHTPILILTSLDDMESIGAAYAAGATDFAQKGLAPLVLVERIRFLERAGALQRDLLESEARLAEAQRIARLGHWELQCDGATIAISAMALELLALEAAQARTIDALGALLSPEDAMHLARDMATAHTSRGSFTRDVRIRAGSPAERYLHLEGELSDRIHESAATFILTMQDLTLLRRAEQNAHLAAHYDPVTGLPNLVQLREHLQRCIAAARASGARLALVACDIEQFHRYNESGGMEAGNALLAQLGQRMEEALERLQTRGEWSETALVARLGGDEFAIALPMEGPFERLAETLETLQRQVQRPVRIGDAELPISVTMGVVVYPDDGVDAQALIHHAGAALHQAKQVRRGGHVFYSAPLQQQATRRLSLEADLRRAVERDQLEVWFQPRISLATMAPLGCEALVRWRHPEHGLISPAEFIPMAEESGLIVEIGEWVLDRSCRAAVSWREAGMQMQVAVNVSAVQLLRGAITDSVTRVLAAEGLAPELLELEITEGVLIDMPAPVRSALESLKMRGVRIALDDFGTGYSSLNYLRQLPIDCLKIDRSFICDLGQTADGDAIVRAIVTLARSLKLRTVAEGVETLAQFDFLAAHDCDEIQGFLFARPMPEAALASWWSEWLAAPPRCVRSPRAQNAPSGEAVSG